MTPVDVVRGNVDLTFTNCEVDGVLHPDTLVQTRDDGTTQAKVATTARGVFVGGMPRRRPSTADDEMEAARKISIELNRIFGTAYDGVLEKNKNDYPDAYLESKRPNETKIPLQVTHPLRELTAKFKKGELSRYEQNGVPAKMQAAIDRKAAVDPSERAKTILVLFCPVPLGRAIRERLSAEKFDQKGFLQVWVSSFGEDAFRLESD